MARRFGFTLIEMVVTITILVIFSALVVPEVAKLQQRNVVENFFPNLQSAFIYARNQAVAQNTITVAQFDPSSNSFVVSDDSALDPLMPGQGQSNPDTGPVQPQTGANSAPVQDPFNQASQPGMEAPPTPVASGSISKTVPMPPDYQPSQWQLNGQQVDQTTWDVRFYPDGTSDQATLTFDYGSFQKTLMVNQQGQTVLIDGPAPDPTTLIWQGGTFEPRQ